MPLDLFNYLNRSVVVAMVAVRMMEAAVNQVIHVVTMGNRGMAAIGTMNVLRRAFISGESRGAFVRIGRINGNRVFVHMILVWMMQMAIVEVIYMPFMLDGDMPAAGCVDVSMVRMRCTSLFAHNCFGFFHLSPRFFQNNYLIPPLTWQEMFLQVTCI